MKTVIAKGKYAVSFNCYFDADNYSCGEEDRYTIDFAGDDIEALAQEVINDNPDYPLFFKRFNNEDAEYIIGAFFSVDDPEYPDALMVLYEYM